MIKKKKNYLDSRIFAIQYHCPICYAFPVLFLFSSLFTKTNINLLKFWHTIFINIKVVKKKICVQLIVKDFSHRHLSTLYRSFWKLLCQSNHFRFFLLFTLKCYFEYLLIPPFLFRYFFQFLNWVVAINEFDFIYTIFTRKASFFDILYSSCKCIHSDKIIRRIVIFIAFLRK